MTKNDIQGWLTLVFICLFVYACNAPRPKRPHPPGKVVYQLGWKCTSIQGKGPRDACEYDLQQEWLKNNPKDQWVWY